MFRISTVFIFAAVIAAQGRPPASERPAGPWTQYADLSDAGYDATRIAAARAFAERSGSAAVVLVQDGRIVFAWGDPSQRFRTASIRKSLLSLMFGSPVVAPTIHLDQSVGDLGIDDRLSLSVRERSATVDQLLSARSGVYHPAAFEPASMTANRPRRGSAEPGAAWFYNNWDFNALGTVYRLQSGMDVFTGFQSTLAQPLGLEDFRPQDGVFVREPSRSQHPAYEFRLSARDLARIGQLVVQDGRWEGRQVVSAAWLSDSTRVRTTFPEGGGYAYLWWIDAARFRARGHAFPALDAVRDIAATGLGEQLMLVIPSLNLVFVHLTYGEGSGVAESASYRLVEMVLDARRGHPKPDARTTPVAPQRFANERPAFVERVGVPFSGTPADFTGQYEVSANIRATITFVDGALFIDMPGRGEAELFQQAPDTFFLQVADVVLSFERNAAGAVQGMRMTERGRSFAARKLP
jgi:CubicO group peptidase (beta-lactamase class C family)